MSRMSFVETAAEKANRLARTFSPALNGPVGSAACGCPNNTVGAAPALHVCRACGHEGGYESVHQNCAGCAYLAE